MLKKTTGILTLLIALTLLIPMGLTAEERTYTDGELEWLLKAVAAPACGGPCLGISLGYAVGEKKCDDLTDEEKAALTATACGNADKPTARRNANNNCLDRDASGNCLCSGGVFTPPDAEDPADNSDGVCSVTCTVAYVGECTILAIAEPTPETTTAASN